VGILLKLCDKLRLFLAYILKNLRFILSWFYSKSSKILNGTIIKHNTYLLYVSICK
jgi:hypothetical protein